MYVSYFLHVLALSKPETLHKGWEKFFHSRLTNITDPQTDQGLGGAFYGYPYQYPVPSSCKQCLVH